MKTRLQKTILLSLLAGASAHGATSITSVTLNNPLDVDGDLSSNVDYDVISVSAGGQTYSLVEGSTASSVNGLFISSTASTDDGRYTETSANFNAAVAGRQISSFVANAIGGDSNTDQVIFTFSQSLDSYDGFAFFEAGSSGNPPTPNNVANLQLRNSGGTVVGNFDLLGANQSLVANHPDDGGFYRFDSVDRISVGIVGGFFQLSDFTEVLGQDITTATEIRLSGTDGIDPAALVALTIPEPSAAILSFLGAAALLRRRR